MVQKGELEIIKSVWRIIRGLFFDPKKQTEFQELGGFFLLGKCISYLDNQISDLSITTLEEVLQFLVGASKLQHLQEIVCFLLIVFFCNFLLIFWLRIDNGRWIDSHYFRFISEI